MMQTPAYPPARSTPAHAVATWQRLENVEGARVARRRGWARPWWLRRLSLRALRLAAGRPGDERAGA